MSVYIIAEAGVNHNGSLDLAIKLADEAKAAGADCVKYQTFLADELVSKNAVKADYQIENTHNNDSQYKMLKELELPFDDFIVLKEHCRVIGIDFMSTAFDFKSIDFLASINTAIWKIPSGEITNLPYLETVARTGKPVMLSTGMCTDDEVGAAYEVLKNSGAGKITLLHCTTDYPAPIEKINLNVIPRMKAKYRVDVGYSDHTASTFVPAIAVALGAVVIEKHFTLDRTMEGPDHKASLDAAMFAEMVSHIRMTEQALGDGIKSPTDVEIKTRSVVRKSIVAKAKINKGDIFSEENLTVKRPGDGVSAMLWHDVLGRISDRDYNPDEKIVLE